MKVQTIEAGRVTQVSAGRFGYSLKINGALVPQGVQPFGTQKEAKADMMWRVGYMKRMEAEKLARQSSAAVPAQVAV